MFFHSLHIGNRLFLLCAVILLVQRTKLQVDIHKKLFSKQYNTFLAALITSRGRILGVEEMVLGCTYIFGYIWET